MVIQNPRTESDLKSIKLRFQISVLDFKNLKPKSQY